MDVLHLRQHLLAALVQHVLLLGEQVVDLVGVEGKVRDLAAQRVEAFAGKAHQLRHQKGGALGGGAVFAEDGLIELFVVGVCHLGVVVAVGVGEQLCKELAAPGVQVQGFQQGMAVLADAALHGAELIYQLAGSGEVLFPLLLGGVDILQIPIFVHR